MNIILDILLVIFGFLSFLCALVYLLAGLLWILMLIVYKRDERISKFSELKGHCLFLLPGAVKVLSMLAILIAIDYLK